MEYYSAFLLQLNMEPCFSADTPPLSGIHIKQLSSHLYMALFPQIIITPLSDTYSFSTIPPLYDTIFYILRGYYPTFICGFTAASVPHLYLALFHHILRWHLLCGVSFLHPPLLVTFTLHLLPYYSTLMWHFHRASPRSISTHLNMVSFSLFLSRLYMTLILFIITRQYYSPQLLRGGFSHHFLLSTGSFSHLSLAFLQIITF